MIIGGDQGVKDVFKFDLDYAAYQHQTSLNIGRKHHGCATYEEGGTTKVITLNVNKQESCSINFPDHCGWRL